MKHALKTPKKDAMERHLRGILVDRIQNRDSLKNSVEEILELLCEQFYDPDIQTAQIWSLQDVHAVRPDLTNEQAFAVLQEAQTLADAGHWLDPYQLERCAIELFGDSRTTQVTQAEE